MSKQTEVNLLNLLLKQENVHSNDYNTINVYDTDHVERRKLTQSCIDMKISQLIIKILNERSDETYILLWHATTNKVRVVLDARPSTETRSMEARPMQPIDIFLFHLMYKGWSSLEHLAKCVIEHVSQ